MAISEMHVDPETGEVIEADDPRHPDYVAGDPGPTEADAGGSTGAIGTGGEREEVTEEVTEGDEEEETETERTLREQLEAAQREREARILAKVKAKEAEAAERQKAIDAAAADKPKPAAAPPKPAPAPKPAATGTAVTTKSAAGSEPEVSGELAEYMPTGVPADRAHLSDLFAKHRGKGIDFRQEDLAIPRLYLLQDMSEQVKERSAAYVPGARPGMWFNTVTNELSPGFLGIPIKYTRRYVGWYPRKESGGAGGLARMDIPEAEFLAMEEAGIGVRRYMQEQPEGDPKLAEAVETPEWVILCLRRPPLIHIPVALSFPKTKSKVSQQLNAILSMQADYLEDGTEYTLPSFANVIKFAARVEGEGAQSYFVPTVEYVARVTRADLFNRCAAIFEQFDAGTVHVVGNEAAA